MALGGDRVVCKPRIRDQTQFDFRRDPCSNVGNHNCGRVATRVAAAYLLSKAAELTSPERIYLAYFHIPKATIQAVFGAAPLIAFRAHGDEQLVGDGQTLLIMAILAIVVTAPIGAVLLDSTANQLLCEADEED